MDEEILEKLLTKLIALTEFGALRWHFAGDVSKAYVTVYKDARLKLTELALDITELEGDTVRVDARLHEGTMRELLESLYKAAKESSSRFRTGQVKAVSSSSLSNTCQRLLTDEQAEPLELCSCNICGEKFEAEKSPGHICQLAAGKQLYACVECVDKLGRSGAHTRLMQAIYGEDVSGDDDPINSETLTDVYADHRDAATQQLPNGIGNEQENL
jgi:hypothetical protein